MTQRHQTLNCWNAVRDKKEVIIAFNHVQSAMKFMRWLNAKGDVYKDDTNKRS